MLAPSLELADVLVHHLLLEGIHAAALSLRSAAADEPLLPDSAAAAPPPAPIMRVPVIPELGVTGDLAQDLIRAGLQPVEGQCGAPAGVDHLGALVGALDDEVVLRAPRHS